MLSCVLQQCVHKKLYNQWPIFRRERLWSWTISPICPFEDQCFCFNGQMISSNRTKSQRNLAAKNLANWLSPNPSPSPAPPSLSFHSLYFHSPLSVCLCLSFSLCVFISVLTCSANSFNPDLKEFSRIYFKTLALQSWILLNVGNSAKTHNHLSGTAQQSSTQAHSRLELENLKGLNVFYVMFFMFVVLTYNLKKF